MTDKWIPEIYYEENAEGVTKNLPFIKVPKDKTIPSAFFIYEVKDIAEDEEVEQEVELTLHMYANMTHLKENLDLETLNKVRNALGLNDLSEAIKKGNEITKKVNSNLE